ncbi:MAG: sugar-binding transcriptional regulator [Oricola sp.]|nr:MAG: sugar-binding transcriptional regulator [Oricola sp.]
MSNEQARSANRLPVDEGRDQLMVQVARMAYQQDLTHTDIASRTGLNRWQVSRLLQEARDLGVVRIEIVPRSDRCPNLETDLLNEFGLADAVVLPDNVDGSGGLEGLAKAAGQYLAALKPRPTTFGVSWGRTMAAVAHWLPDGWAAGVDVVQINGAVAPIPGDQHQNDVAETFARKGDGRFIPLPVPAIVGQPETRQVLERDRIVADVLRRARSVEAICFSLGALNGDSALLNSGNLLEHEYDSLRAKGAVGDIVGRFIDRTGEIVDAGIDGRTIGLPLSDLKTRDRAICVAAGAEKFQVVVGALRARLFSVLITDAATATYALEHAHDR